MKSRAKKLLPYLGGCLLFTSSLFANDKTVISSNATLTPITNPDGSPIVKTEEDIQRGKENVSIVIDELRNLFSKNSYESLNNIKSNPIAPAYSKVITNKDGMSTLVYRARFTTAKDMSKAIESLATTKATFDYVSERNTVMVTDATENIEYYKQLFEAVDIPSSQILIEAKIVEVLFSDGMYRNLSFGFNDGKTSVGSTTSIPGESDVTSGLAGAFTPGNFDLSFNWLISASDAKVVSSPNILVTRNETARIVTAEELPIQEANTVSDTLTYTTTYKQVGVTLEVEPQMINDEDVTIRLYPQVSTVLRYEDFPTGASDGGTYPVPVVSIRSAESYVRVHNEQVVVLGGLYTNRDILQEERIPVLSDIPFIGELFTGKNKTREVMQLVFFIKIHIIPPEKVSNGFLYDPNIEVIQSEDLVGIIDNPTTIPETEKGVSGLFDEMLESLDKSWKSDLNRRRVLGKEYIEKVKEERSEENEAAK